MLALLIHRRRSSRKYFEVYFPQAIRLAADLRTAGDERYVWTTGSWLIYQYLEQAAPAERKQMEEALDARRSGVACAALYLADGVAGQQRD